MNVHIDDSEFIDLINACTADEIAAVETQCEDLESELSDKADEDYVDDIANDLRNEWSADLDTMREQIETNSPVAQLDNEVHHLELEIEQLSQQVMYLDLALTALMQPGPIRRAYNRMLAMSSSINWYSPKL